jgi:hypothetical protein
VELGRLPSLPGLLVLISFVVFVVRSRAKSFSLFIPLSGVVDSPSFHRFFTPSRLAWRGMRAIGVR